MINSQDYKILSEIIFRNEGDSKRIKEKYQLSNRQLNYVISKVNEILVENHLKKVETSGTDIHVENQSLFFLQQYLLNMEYLSDVYPSEDLRRVLIEILLLSSTDYLTLNHLIISLMSSKSTIVNDLKIVRKSLASNQLVLRNNRNRGYFVEGDESVIRYRLLKLTMQFLHQDNGEMFLNDFVQRCYQIDGGKVIEDITQLCNNYDTSFFENTFKEFVFGFILLNSRLLKDELKLEFPIEIDSSCNEYQFSYQLCQLYHINNYQAISYIAALIFGSSTGDIHKETSDKMVIIELIKNMIYRFEHLAGLKFVDEQAIILRLYIHIRPSYYRLKYYLPTVNPLTSEIKSEYESMFLLAKESIQPMKNFFGREIPEEEIAYIALHFAISIFHDQDILTHKRYRALVLCPNGIGTSMILLHELEALFPNIEFDNQSFLDSLDLESYDIIFTTKVTQSLFKKQLNYIFVNPIMNEKEKYLLIGKVYKLIRDDSLLSNDEKGLLSIIEKHVDDNQYDKIATEFIYNKKAEDMKNNEEEGGISPLLSEITDPRLVQLNVEASDWEDAIRKSTKVLVTNNKVSEEYIDGMIQTTKESGPYIVITKHVALPHARPECGAKEIAISISSLKTPIRFGNKENDPVKYIFGLSALDNKTHLKAMSELAELLDNPEFYRIIDQAKKPQEIFDYIKKYESE